MLWVSVSKVLWGTGALVTAQGTDGRENASVGGMNVPVGVMIRILEQWGKGKDSVRNGSVPGPEKGRTAVGKASEHSEEKVSLVLLESTWCPGRLQ